MELKVLHGNNIELLKQYPDNYFDSVVTDPPYGLGNEPNAEELMKDWVEHGYHEVKGKGFMGKEWDAFVPQPNFWKEVFRVLKHGGHVVSFFGTRTYDWGVMAMRFAGFEIRDCIQWLYGSGFPKSYNVGNVIEAKILYNDASGRSQKLLNGESASIGHHLHKISYEQGVENKDYSIESREKVINVEYQTEQGKQWKGWGSSLKPANEPIVLARKPFEKGLRNAENILKWGTGGINIDGCRVRVDENDPNHRDTKPSKSADSSMFNIGGINYGQNDKGRFPANLILTHHPECECKGLKKVKGITGGKNEIVVQSKFGQVSDIPQKPFDYTDENGQETIEVWECHHDCPIKIMDEQSGGASRFFYVAKASKSERNNGLKGFEVKSNMRVNAPRDKEEDKTSNKMQNFHPTVKPVKLMQYLARLVTPPNGIVLDPFCGSGTTGIACKLEGFNFVGMEQDPEYHKIAEDRISNYVEEPEDELELIEEETESPKMIQGSLF